MSAPASRMTAAVSSLALQHAPHDRRELIVPPSKGFPACNSREHNRAQTQLAPGPLRSLPPSPRYMITEIPYITLSFPRGTVDRNPIHPKPLKRHAPGRRAPGPTPPIANHCRHCCSCWRCYSYGFEVNIYPMTIMAIMFAAIITYFTVNADVSLLSLFLRYILYCPEWQTHMPRTLGLARVLLAHPRLPKKDISGASPRISQLGSASQMLVL